ncbi:DUF6111 family protein [Methylobacterium organophilum]|uniref:Uncharacterized protein n=1 Tax=Methylobacterium organophilum TaxID=410 RepID=A0ABQ4T466_METOR|nr:DUF6111 family protein [Methylobacterium organophilum]UMY19235.1 DUF6111 family protein [Methylobacterium organophilum]GJE25294.1 hypothetical protein LKMONMHP_0129 [Methylobacterium organophilum]
MGRLVLQELAVFALPFLAFAAYLLFARRSPLDRMQWDPYWTRLVMAGLFAVVASLVMTGITATRHQDGWVPSRIENGRLVPGHFE